MDCPLCERDCPEALMEAHHLKTRRVDKADTELICQACHRTIHALFTHHELRRTALGTIEGLRADERFIKAVGFIQRANPQTRLKVRASKRRRGWA
ncbi:HNH endonuclease [Myxococcota bacterium]|nr:HNH endonuclease [Myxococcota bacterium]MBU1430579.1 HNH endonuclease [Myxococcota bacterium]MBU1896383.1 HNH endonuclease [Myxococcota bacterium]